MGERDRPIPGRVRRLARAEGVVAILFLAIGAWQGVAAISDRPAQQRLRPALNGEAFIAGRTAAAVNQVMAHQLPSDPLLRAAGGVLRYNLFGSGGPQVRVGCDDTLFLTEELRPWAGAEAAMAERAAGLRRIQAALAQRGIAVIIAIVPDKARVLSDRLCGAPWSAQSRARHGAWLAALRGVGVTHVVPLLPALAAQGARPEGAYYRTDTHWNQDGARAAARAITAAIADRELSRNEDFRSGLAEDWTNGPGDLLRLMSLDRVPDPLRPAPDRERRARTEPAEATTEGGGLLDEVPSAEVALIGSSYSVNANFHGFLQETLRSSIYDAAEAGGGFAGAAAAYLAGENFRESPPRLIIWEIPERVVAQPVTAAERAFIARW